MLFSNFLVFISIVVSNTFNICMSNFTPPKVKDGGNIQFLPVFIDTPTSIIDNHCYFEKLILYHSANSDNACTLVAAEILLSYYDTFYNDNIVLEEHEYKATGPSNNIYSFTHSPGSGQGEYHQNLYSELYEGVAAYPGPYADLINREGINTQCLRLVMQDYLVYYNINATVDQSYFAKQTNIMNAIDNNIPIIVSNAKHCMVAYAYSEDYVWVHTGNYSCGVLPWSEFTQIGASWVRINYDDEHVCSDNYINSTTNQGICPVHGVFDTITIHPEDFCFRERYVDPYETTNFSISPLSISTQRYRCGYICEEYVNISPKKYGYGQAYLMVFFDKPIANFSFNLSYWQILDVLDPLDSTATITFMNYDYEYWDYDNQINLLSVNLPTDRTNQLTLNYSFSDGSYVSGFWIKATSPATGTRNLGRISIGDIIVRFKYLP